MPTVTPRIETETAYSPRLELAPELPVLAELAEPSDPRWSMPVLVLAGAAVLALGLAALQTGNFVAAEFARSRFLGGLTLLVALTGFALIALGLWREARALASLQSVDRLRRDLAGSAPHARTAAARTWLARLPRPGRPERSRRDRTAAPSRP